MVFLAIMDKGLVHFLELIQLIHLNSKKTSFGSHLADQMATTGHLKHAKWWIMTDLLLARMHCQPCRIDNRYLWGIGLKIWIKVAVCFVFSFWDYIECGEGLLRGIYFKSLDATLCCMKDDTKPRLISFYYDLYSKLHCILTCVSKVESCYNALPLNWTKLWGVH